MKKLLCLIVMALVISTGVVNAEEVEYYGTVLLDGEFLDGDIVKVSVYAEEIEYPVLGIAFNLKYDPENVAFLKYEPGEFLEAGGDPFYLVKDDSFGDITFGETLRKDDDFPLGSGKIADVYFQILTETELAFGFEKGVVSTLDSVRQDIDQILWEDLRLNRGDESYSVSPIISSQSESNIKKYIPIALVIIAFGSAFLVVRLLKLKQKKRHEVSVNFK